MIAMRQQINEPFVLTESGSTILNQESAMPGNIAQTSHGGIQVTVTGNVQIVADTELVILNAKITTLETESSLSLLPHQNIFQT
jgi:hypothetical protein